MYTEESNFYSSTRITDFFSFLSERHCCLQVLNSHSKKSLVCKEKLNFCLFHRICWKKRSHITKTINVLCCSDCVLGSC